MLQLKIFTVLLPIAIIAYALAIRYLGVKMSLVNIIFLVGGYIGVSFFLDAAITNNDKRAVLFFSILIVAMMISGLIIAYGINHAPKALVMMVCGYLLIFGAPLFGLLGSYKITPVHDNPKQWYETHIRTVEEFQELRAKYKITPFLYLFIILFFIYAGYISVAELSKNLGIVGVIASILLVVMLSVRLGGFYNYLVS